MLVKLKGVMTREQFAIAADKLRPFPPHQTQGFREKFGLLGGLNLTKEQLDKIQATSKAVTIAKTTNTPQYWRSVGWCSASS